MSKMSRRIVVDASVARAAGTTEHPVSTQSREFLQTMLKVCHRVVMTPDIGREWRKHRSGFSATWLAAMQSRRKVVNVPVDHAREQALVETVLTSDLGTAQRAAAQKDCLLVSAAWASDGIVASNDDKVRHLLARLAGVEADLAKLVWVNPTEVGEAPVRWLEAGARTRMGAGSASEHLALILDRYFSASSRSTDQPIMDCAIARPA